MSWLRISKDNDREYVGHVATSVRVPLDAQADERFLLLGLGVPVRQILHGTEALTVDISLRKEAEDRIYHQANYHRLTNLPNRVLFSERLSQALERSEYELFYQPIVHLQDESVCSFEALLRWKHPDGTLRLPGQVLAQSV